MSVRSTSGRMLCIQRAFGALGLAVLSGCATGAADVPSGQKVPHQAVPEADALGSTADLWTPVADGWVTDLTGVLPEERKRELSEVLSAHRDATSQEFAVLLIQDLRGEKIEEFALRVARTWGLGQPVLHNGLLIVIALNDRQVRIEVADGLTASITNSFAQRVILEVMVPALREERLADAIGDGLATLMIASR